MCDVSNIDIKKLCERESGKWRGGGERERWWNFFLINCKIKSKIFLGLFNMVLIYYYRE